MATTDQRVHMQAIMHWAIANHSVFHYNQLRPMANSAYYEQDFVNKVMQSGWNAAMDCSEFVTILCKWSGYKDPSGMGYNGFGNSSTMYDHLNHYTDPRRAHLGAIVVFGDHGGTHAALVMDPGGDPMLCSHGSSQGPIAVTLSALVQSMGNPVVTFLDVGGL